MAGKQTSFVATLATEGRARAHDIIARLPEGAVGTGSPPDLGAEK